MHVSFNCRKYLSFECSSHCQPEGPQSVPEAWYGMRVWGSLAVAGLEAGWGSPWEGGWGGSVPFHHCGTGMECLLDYHWGCGQWVEPAE